MVECFKDMEKGKKRGGKQGGIFHILHVSPLTPYEVWMKVSNSMAQVR